MGAVCVAVADVVGVGCDVVCVDIDVDYVGCDVCCC